MPSKLSSRLPGYLRAISAGILLIMLSLLVACAASNPSPENSDVNNIVEENTANTESEPADEPEANDVVQPEEPPAEPTRLSFIAVGDIVAHDLLVEQGHIGPNDYDFSHIFEPMKKKIKSYDLSAITQETPFVDDDSDVSGYPTFGTPWQMGEAIVGSGFDIIVGATNHSMDKGTDGIDRTINFWAEKHPERLHLGMHKDPKDQDSVSIIERNGIRIAFTDCTYGLNGLVLPEGYEHSVDMLYDLDRICDNIKKAQDDCDFTIAFVHMGEEYATVPSDEQRQVAEKLIDAGADVVLGSHVHVVQPMEEVKTAKGNSGIVYFSLGNHVSNQIDVENMLGGAAILEIEKRPVEGGGFETGVVKHEFVPTVCHWNSSTCAEYFLEDYTDELAATHALSFTREQLAELWKSITGLDAKL